MFNVAKTAEEMLEHYDRLEEPDADAVAISALLLSIALTVQQAPKETATKTKIESINNASSFIKNVSDTVESIVICDDARASSLEGIQTILLFLRL